MPKGSKEILLYLDLHSIQPNLLFGSTRIAPGVR